MQAMEFYSRDETPGPIVVWGRTFNPLGPDSRPIDSRSRTWARIHDGTSWSREFDLGNQNSKGKFFDDQKIPLRRISGTKPRAGEKEAGLMHQKFAIVDRNVVLAGSYNWTYAAESLNDENLLVFRDAGPLAEEYRSAFLRLWERRP